DQAAGEDVRALHGDGHGNLLISTAGEVVRPQTDALAALDVHGVVEHVARAFGDVVFDDAGNDRRLLAQVQRAGGHAPRRVHHVEVAAHACERLFDALELANGSDELPAHHPLG